MLKPTTEGHATMKRPFDSMICKLFYLITLMLCCIVMQGEALNLMQDCRWVSIWGLVSLYGVQALQKVTLALVE